MSRNRKFLMLIFLILLGCSQNNQWLDKRISQNGAINYKQNAQGQMVAVSGEEQISKDDNSTQSEINTPRETPTENNNDDLNYSQDFSEPSDYKKPDPVVIPPATNITASCYKGEPLICEAENKVIELTNEYRAQNGLQPLVASSKLSFVSREWSERQANQYGMTHYGFPWIRENFFQDEFPQVPFNILAENVAYTSYISKNADSIGNTFARMWYDSYGHRRNMLGPYRSVGVGVYIGQNGVAYATMILGDVKE